MPISQMIQVRSEDPVAHTYPVYSNLQQLISPLCPSSFVTLVPDFKSQMTAVLSKEQVIA